MSWWAHHKQRLDVLETGGGWFVERDGRAVTLLTDPQFVEMFCAAWNLEPLTADPEVRAAIASDGYWDPQLLSRTAFRSREYGTIAAAFWAGEGPFHEGRLIVRGLYQPIRAP
jgi:hypothetical protein